MEEDGQAESGSPDEQTEQTEQTDQAEQSARPKPPRRTLILLVGPIIALTVAGTVASIFFPYLSTHHPLLLIMLDARNRMLVVAREVDLAPFVIIALFRRTLSDPLFYLLGRFYGEGAIRWLEKKGGFGGLVPITEKLFSKAGYPMVFLFPGALICALAGTTGMPFAGFLAANVTGTIVSIFAVRAFSDVVASPVESLLGFFERNLVLSTAITAGLVLLSLLLNKVQGKLESPSIEKIETELEADNPAATKPADSQSGDAS